MPRVMIHPAADYESVGPAVDRAFELFPLDLSGKRVLIKPNVLRACDPAEAVTTHPAVLRAVVERVAAMGPAELIVGDNAGVFSYGANEGAFRATGLLEAAKGYYRNIGTEARTVAFDPRFLPSVSISEAVFEADVLISVPRFKTHGLTVISGAIKNSFGLLPGAQKAKLHRAAGTAERFHEAIVEVFRARVPDLFIMDAVVGMEGNGPASPDLRHVGLVLAADNGVAMDSVVAALMGCDPGRLRFLQRAKALGLGDYDLAGIEVVGEFVPVSGYALPPLGGEAITGNPDVHTLMEGRSRFRPEVDPDACTGCGTCVEHCPVSALTLEDALPRVDPETCIACFCCQELCPEKAIALG